LEALASWTWMNYLPEHIPSGKKPCLLNLDETSVHYYYGDKKGNVSKTSLHPQGHNAATQKVTRKDMRACVTHAAILAENPEVQQILPQWVLGNTNVMLKRDVTKVHASVAPNIQFIRGKSGWMNVTVMVKLLKEIAKRVGDHDPQWQIILMLDCARQHIHEKITAAARRYNVWLVYVPAKLTWLLQPCDTHLFAPYKREMQKQYDNERAHNPTGRVSYAAWMLAIAKTIVKVLESSTWQRAFAETGWTMDQQHSSLYLLRHLDPQTLLPAPAERPTDTILQTCLPHGVKLHVSRLLPPPAFVAIHTHPPHEPLSLPPSGHALVDEPLAQAPSPARPLLLDEHLHHTPSSSSTHWERPTAPCPPAGPATVAGPHRERPRQAWRTTATPECSQDGPISRRTRSRSFVTDSEH
jgi:DDE superfamily endonuclease